MGCNLVAGSFDHQGRAYLSHQVKIELPNLEEEFIFANPEFILGQEGVEFIKIAGGLS